MNKQQYQKLKQLDKIEYLLLKRDLDEKHQFSLFSSFGGIIYAIMWYMLFAILLLGFWGSKELFYKMSLLAIIIKFTFIIICILYIINLILYFLKLKRLNKHFIK